MSQPSKPISLRTLLTITTGRFLTKRKSSSDNGIGDLYEALGWMTDDSPMTHQLGRFAEECKPWLLKWFPELAPCGVLSSLDSLDKWLRCDRTDDHEEGVRMWLAELKMMFPALKDVYDVQRIPQGAHKEIHPLAELVAMRGGKTEGVVIVAPTAA